MNMDTLLKTGNVFFDAILSAKTAQAKAEDIAVTVKANLPDSLTISDVELSIVIGNLLDYAIEACRAEAILHEHGGWVQYNSEEGAFISEFLVPVIE